MKNIKYYEGLGLINECNILREHMGRVNEIQQMIDDGKTEFKLYDYPIFTWTGNMWMENRQLIHLVAEANGYFTKTIVEPNNSRRSPGCTVCRRRAYETGQKVIHIGKESDFEMSIKNRAHKNIIYYDRKKRTTIKNKMRNKLGPPIPKRYEGRGYSDSDTLWGLRFDSKYYFKHIPKDICTVIGSYLN